jgi:hypothetical protein
MLSVRGIYQKGEVILQEKVVFNEPMKVIITFLDEIPENGSSKPRKFSFNQSRKLLGDIEGSLLDETSLKQE